MRSGEGRRRLKSIEQSLDAQEIMLLWLEEARQHDSLPALVRSRRDCQRGLTQSTASPGKPRPRIAFGI